MEPILFRTKEAAKLCGITAKTWRSWSQFGKTPRPLVIGKLHFWRYEELVEWVAAGCPSRKDWEASRFTAGRASARKSNPLPLVASPNTSKRRLIHNSKP